MFTNKGVVITGGNHGIGKQICLDYLEAGAKICMIDMNANLDEALIHPNLYFFHGDIASKNVLDEFIQFSKKTLDTIDILINNACLSKKGLLSNCSYEDFDYVLSVGIKAPYELTRQLQFDLKKNKGCIINIASSRSFQSQPNTESYSVVKGGITALTHSSAMSLAPDVRVNAIAPGWIDCYETLEFSLEDKMSIPVGRVGVPKDISDLTLFLTSDKAGFIHGETYVVDGGMSKQMIYHDDYGWNFCGNHE